MTVRHVDLMAARNAEEFLLRRLCEAVALDFDALGRDAVLASMPQSLRDDVARTVSQMLSSCPRKTGGGRKVNLEGKRRRTKERAWLGRPNVYGL